MAIKAEVFVSSLLERDKSDPEGDVKEDELISKFVLHAETEIDACLQHFLLGTESETYYRPAEKSIDIRLYSRMRGITAIRERNLESRAFEVLKARYEAVGWKVISQKTVGVNAFFITMKWPSTFSG